MNKAPGILPRLASILKITLAVVFLIPLIFTVLVSFRPEAEPVTKGSIFFGSEITLINYQRALVIAPWSLHYLNSFLFVAGTLAVQLATVTCAAYAFARLRFFGRNLFLMIILLQLMIPSGVLLVQNFRMINILGLFDTRIALMMPYWGSAFGVLLLRQTFREIPIELDEAARIDGANLLQVIRHVYVSNAIPAYLAFALVSVSSHWNEFLWPFIITRSEEIRPLTVGLNKLIKTTDQGAFYGQLMAGTLIVVTPLVILFVLFQRQFVESFARSGIR
ncbi:MAG: carbohydrate ABC transporter permease [Chloroflexi bacterium]|nr:carbohydrate ABC transporter permease [Chloroflexota bacterium]